MCARSTIVNNKKYEAHRDCAYDYFLFWLKILSLSEFAFIAYQSKINLDPNRRL